MTSKSDSTGINNQFHHYIPRLILKRFRIDAYKPTLGPARPQGLARSHRRKRIQAIKEDEQKNEILLYDLSTAKLLVRPIQRAFEENNLYRNEGDPNPNHIEASFSKLEGHVSYIIDSIHGAMVSPDKVFKNTRKDLRILRKFLLMQSYRASELALSYKMKSHEPLRGWTAQAKEDTGLKSNGELWRYCMNYLLETPHEILVDKGLKIVKRLGEDLVNFMRRTVVDPNLNWLALDYATLAKDYDMCICEAANDAEFILGDNSFGIDDGFTNSGEFIHKVYILTPRIAKILHRLDYDSANGNPSLPSILGTLSRIQMKKFR